MRNIEKVPFTQELKTNINKEFTRYAIAEKGFDGVAEEPIAFVAKENNIVMGICVVQLFWGNLHVKNLLVYEEYRRAGVGRELIAHALEFGKKQGCKFAYVETMSFQAPEFYQKLGFRVELKRDDYAGNSSFYYLRKDL
ncbi:MAG: GNAT family N-acetyltransferase [Rickettsiaceae bacterium]|nr:GNAT family N-acetyltransferase [Rickettsiaceae bacterium]